MERWCAAEGCDAPLNKPYYSKKKLCKHHMQAGAVVKRGEPGQWWRFCFQCGKLQALHLFDGKARSCRARLELRRRTKRPSHASYPAGGEDFSSHHHGIQQQWGRHQPAPDSNPEGLNALWEQQQQLQGVAAWGDAAQEPSSRSPAEGTATTSSGMHSHAGALPDAAAAACSPSAAAVVEADAASLQAALEEALAVPLGESAPLQACYTQQQQLYYQHPASPAAAGMASHGLAALSRTSTAAGLAAALSEQQPQLQLLDQAAVAAASASAGAPGGVADAGDLTRIAADQLAAATAVEGACIASLQQQCQQLQARLQRQASTMSGMTTAAGATAAAASGCCLVGSACLQQLAEPAPLQVQQEAALARAGSLHLQQPMLASNSTSSPGSTATAVHAAMHLELAQLVASQFEAADAAAEADELEALLERELLAAAALPAEQAQNGWACRLNSTIDRLSRSISGSVMLAGPCGLSAAAGSDPAHAYHAAAAACGPAPSAPAALLGGGCGVGPVRHAHLAAATSCQQPAQLHGQVPAAAASAPAAAPAFDDRLSVLQQQLVQLQGMIVGLRAEII